MQGIIALDELLSSISPKIQSGEYVFCTVEGPYIDFAALNPLGTFMEPEGLTLILPIAAAKKAQLSYDSIFKQITLTIHSSLDAVGLTATVSTKLTEYDISANIVAAYYHDHIFVQAEKADEALVALKELSAAN